MQTKNLMRAVATALMLSAAAVALGDDSQQVAGLLDECNQLACNDYGSSVSSTLSCCDPWDDANFWFAGSEFTALQIHAKTGGRGDLVLNNLATTDVVDLTLQGAQGMDDFAFAPRLWLGRQFDDWGIVARYWRLTDDDVSLPGPPPGVVNAPTFLTLTDTSRAQLYAIDAEAFTIFHPGRWKLDASLGVRHASISVQSELAALGVFILNPGTLATMQSADGFGFDGTGITSGFTARRQIGNSSATFFLSGRASYLGGHTDSFARTTFFVAELTNPAAVASGTNSRLNQDGELDIFEFQTGVEWDFQLRNFPVKAFFRTAFELQNWDVDGSPSGGVFAFGDVPPNSTTPIASTFNVTRGGIGGAHLYGLTCGAGFTW